MTHLFVVLLMLVNASAHAAIYKCSMNGQISYSDSPCEGDVTVVQGDAIKSSPDLEEGLSAFENRKYDVAFRRLKPLSEAGVAMAQNVLGRMYLSGRGVPLDYDKALALFRSAASQGLPNAKNNLGVMYTAGLGIQQDYIQAVAWFREAANQGYALAMDNLADMYEQGLGVRPDRGEARHWRVKAHNAGFSGKQDVVHSRTVGHDEYKKGLEFYYRWQLAEAAKLFLKAAEKGYPEAQLIMGEMYRYGDGVKKDETQALYWTKKAETAGHTMEDGRDRALIHGSSSEFKVPPLQPKYYPAPGKAPSGTVEICGGHGSSQ